MHRLTATALIILACLSVQAQPKGKRKVTHCSLAIEVPNRLATISSTEKEIVYRDKQTQAILTFTKANLDDYEFDLEFTANQVHAEIKDDPSYKAVDLEELDLKFANAYVLDWSENSYSPNRKNDHNTMAMIDVCGQYYNFTFSMPQSDRDEMRPVFDDIIASIETTKP